MAKDVEFEITFFESVLQRDPGDLGVLEILSRLYAKAGRLEEGLRADRAITSLQPENPVAHYNLACSLALSRRWDESVEELRRAIGCGYRDFTWMLEDPDLRELQEQQVFGELCSDYDIPLK